MKNGYVVKDYLLEKFGIKINYFFDVVFIENIASAFRS